MSTMPELITSAQAADRLGILDVTLRSWRFRGYGPPSIKLGVAVFYRPEDVAEWIRDRDKAAS